MMNFVCLLFCLWLLAPHDAYSSLYEGRSINKLQNGFIPLIFKIWKFGNIR